MRSRVLPRVTRRPERIIRRFLRSTLLLLSCAACGDRREAAQETAALGAVGAHDHGVARVNIAVDDTVVTIELIAPGMSLYGFEGDAATAEQTAARARTLSRLRGSFASMFEFAAEAGCVVGEPVIELGDADGHDASTDTAREDEEQEHDEVHATARVSCRQTPAGTRLRLAVGKLFPDVQQVDLQVVSTTGQSGARVAASGYVVRL
jgi:hypothetical protein